MATQNTTLYNSQSDVLTAGIVARSTDDGKLRVIMDSYTTTSAVTATSQYIVLCRLPKGAKVISAQFIVPAGVGTTAGNLGYYTIGPTGTLTVGDVDRWGGLIAQSLNAAGRFELLTTPADADYITTTEVAVVYMPMVANFATAITFTYIILYTTGN